MNIYYMSHGLHALQTEAQGPGGDLFQRLCHTRLSYPYLPNTYHRTTWYNIGTQEKFVK